MNDNFVDVKGSSILIVDDTPANLDLLWKTLEPEGYRISGAPSGEVALKIVAKSQPDLILLDIMMPEMDGFSVCENLKKNKETRDIPVIFITAKVESVDIATAFFVGGVDYITKPFRHIEVCARVRTHLELRKIMRQHKKMIEQLSTLNQRLRENDARARFKAYHDALTKLPNRLLMRARLKKALVYAKSKKVELGIFYLDLDRFKPINDTLGHHVGDMLLQAVSDRLRELVNKEDTVARLGGDEFAVIQKIGAGMQGSARLAKRIIDRIQEPYMLDGNTVRTSTSIGIALYPTHSRDIDRLLKRADSAMYKAKNRGKNTFVFYKQKRKSSPIEEEESSALSWIDQRDKNSENSL